MITEIYFVKKGQPKSGRNIIGELVGNGNLIPNPNVNTGDVFKTDHNQIGFDPFPGEIKDLIIVLNNGKELRFTENYNGNMGVNENRKITIKIP